MNKKLKKKLQKAWVIGYAESFDALAHRVSMLDEIKPEGFYKPRTRELLDILLKRKLGG